MSYSAYDGGVVGIHTHEWDDAWYRHRIILTLNVRHMSINTVIYIYIYIYIYIERERERERERDWKYLSILKFSRIFS